MFKNFPNFSENSQPNISRNIQYLKDDNKGYKVVVKKISNGKKEMKDIFIQNHKK